LDFECQSGDIILIDEADEIILSDPAKFKDKIQANRCICLTATPDNADKLGVEREVLKLLGLTFLNGQPLGQVPDSSLALDSLESLPFGPDAELIPYIKGRLDEQAVLLYCSLEFLEFLKGSNIPFFHMKDGEIIDDKFLRALDNRAADGAHTLIVATSSFGMRGFDYRARTKGITLVVAASFAHEREKM
jgi:hypothetical protein